MTMYLIHFAKIAAVYAMVMPIGFLIVDTAEEFKKAAIVNAIGAFIIFVLTAMTL